MNKILLNSAFKNVKYVKLDDLLDYIQPTKYIVKSTKYVDDGKIPVLTAGKSLLLGYTNEDNYFDITKYGKVIIFDDFTTSFHLIDYNFKVKSSALKILVKKEKINFNFLYVYYYMKIINMDISSHTRQWISKYSQIKIPIPSIDIQNKIVMILDRYSKLKQELINKINMEILYNNKEYSAYIFNILEKYKLVKIKEKLKILRGKRLTKKDLIKDGNYEVFHGGLEPLGFYSNFNRQKNAVMIINVGASAGTIGFSYKDFWASDGTYTFSPSKDINPRFLYYALKNCENEIKKKVRKAGIPTLDFGDIENIKIPCPSIEEQNKLIIKFDNLNIKISDLNLKLNKEIKLIEKQYNYYMNKLLTFEE